MHQVAASHPPFGAALPVPYGEATAEHTQRAGGPRASHAVECVPEVEEVVPPVGSVVQGSVHVGRKVEPNPVGATADAGGLECPVGSGWLVAERLVVEGLFEDGEMHRSDAVHAQVSGQVDELGKLVDVGAHEHHTQANARAIPHG